MWSGLNSGSFNPDSPRAEGPGLPLPAPHQPRRPVVSLTRAPDAGNAAHLRSQNQDENERHACLCLWAGGWGQDEEPGQRRRPQRVLGIRSSRSPQAGHGEPGTSAHEIPPEPHREGGRGEGAPGGAKPLEEEDRAVRGGRPPAGGGASEGRPGYCGDAQDVPSSRSRRVSGVAGPGLRRGLPAPAPNRSSPQSILPPARSSVYPVLSGSSEKDPVASYDNSSQPGVGRRAQHERAQQAQGVRANCIHGPSRSSKGRLAP